MFIFNFISQQAVVNLFSILKYKCVHFLYPDGDVVLNCQRMG